MRPRSKSPIPVACASIAFPVELKKRAHDAAYARKISLAALVCEALAEKLDAADAARIAKEEQARREQEIPRRPAPLAPDKENISPIREAVTLVREDATADEAIYIEHARKILDALSDPTARSRQVKIAISAIKAKRPLTHPSDQEILQRLEQAVLNLQAGGAEPSLLKQPEEEKHSTLSRLVDRIVSRFDPPTENKE